MDSAFKKLIYWSGHTHSLLGLAVHQLLSYFMQQKGLNDNMEPRNQGFITTL